jgi:hypothetical protein
MREPIDDGDTGIQGDVKPLGGGVRAAVEREADKYKIQALDPTHRSFNLPLIGIKSR